MRSRRLVTRLHEVAGRPEIFSAFERSLSITRRAEGRWTVSVDGGSIPGTFETRAEAWEAGLRAVATQDWPRPSPAA